MYKFNIKSAVAITDFEKNPTLHIQSNEFANFRWPFYEEQE